MRRFAVLLLLVFAAPLEAQDRATLALVTAGDAEGFFRDVARDGFAPGPVDVAGGAAAHSDHGRGVAETFLSVARKETEDYTIARDANGATDLAAI